MVATEADCDMIGYGMGCEAIILLTGRRVSNLDKGAAALTSQVTLNLIQQQEV